MTSWGFSLQRSTTLADVRRPPQALARVATPRVQVGRAAASSTVVRTGMSSGAVAMTLFAGFALGGIVLLTTAKPVYAAIGLLGGLFIGSQLGSETGA